MRFTDAKRNIFDAALEGAYDAGERQAMWRLWLKRRLELTSNGWLLLQFEEMPLESIRLLLADVDELKKGKPMQYLLNAADFLGQTFTLNDAVLIPRPETEELVRWILAELGGETYRVLDLGTGSGVIPISLKLARPHWSLMGMDVSNDALQTAQMNGQTLGAEVDWLLADMLSTEWPDFDVLVSNPPYIPWDDAKSMGRHVTDFEPALALFVPNDRPLVFYERIAAIALQSEVGKHFFMELNHQKAFDIQGLFGDLQSELKVDMQGKIRMLHVKT